MKINKEKPSVKEVAMTLTHLVMTVIFTLTLASCSKDNSNEKEPSDNQISALFGSWTSSSTTTQNQITIVAETTVIFYSNGTVWTKYYAEQKGPGGGAIFDADPIEYRYEVNGNVINIFYLDNTDGKASSVVSYKIIGENLEITRISGDNFPLGVSEKVMTYKRK